MLLSLKQPQALYPQLPASENLQRQYTVKPQGGDGVKEGSPDPQLKMTMPKNPQEKVVPKA